MTDTNINIDIEIAKEIVVSFIGQHQTSRDIYELYEIQSGNNKVLLDHINAMIYVLESAKKQLEEDKNEIQDE